MATVIDALVLAKLIRDAALPGTEVPGNQEHRIPNRSYRLPEEAVIRCGGAKIHPATAGYVNVLYLTWTEVKVLPVVAWWVRRWPELPPEMLIKATIEA